METSVVPTTGSQFQDTGVIKDQKSPFGLLLDCVREDCRKRGMWTEGLQRDLPKKWEKHGNLVILPETSFQSPEWRRIGPDLWRLVSSCLKCDRLGKKRSIINDDFRSPYVELLCGSDGWVEHVDNKITYQYDVTKCMFSIGNISEKLRIASFDCKGETIVDMFAGIGYFTLPYLVHSKASFVFACEWNPDAIEALKRNLSRNKVEHLCTVLEGDCRKVCPIGIADRINLGLLPTTRHYWLTACRALKPSGGYLHIHENITLSSCRRLSKGESVRSDPNSPLVFDDRVQQLSANVEEVTFVESEEESSKNKITKSSPSNVVNQMSKRRLSQRIVEKLESVDTSLPVPSVDAKFLEKWMKVDESYREFAFDAARKVYKYLNNMHDIQFEVIIERIGKIKSYAPHIDHTVLDLHLKPLVVCT